MTQHDIFATPEPMDRMGHELAKLLTQSCGELPHDLSERLRVDVGFVQGTGAAGQLDALRLGFPLIRISGLVRVSDEAAARARAAAAGGAAP